MSLLFAPVRTIFAYSGLVFVLGLTIFVTYQAAATGDEAPAPVVRSQPQERPALDRQAVAGNRRPTLLIACSGSEAEELRLLSAGRPSLAVVQIDRHNLISMSEITDIYESVGDVEWHCADVPE